MASEDRQRLTELMDYSLAQQQLTWEEVAERAGRGGSVAQLRAVRTGRAALSVKTKLAIERGLEWPPGTVDAVLANDRQVIDALRRGELTAAAESARRAKARRTIEGMTFLPDDTREALLEALDREPQRPPPSAPAVRRREAG